jgi:hypothetical protein
VKKISYLVFSILLLGAVNFAQDAQKPPKLTAEEVVAKHLASIGAPEDIKAVKSSVITGAGELAFTPTGLPYARGAAQFASTENKIILAMIFNKGIYTHEKAAFDGKDQTIGSMGGRASPLGEFLKAQGAVLREGLFGGVLSSAWPLLDLKSKKAELKYSDIAEIDGRKVYRLKYASRLGALQVSLFFDAATFQHVRTEYRYTQESHLATVATDSSASKPTNFILTEDFSNFKQAGKLTLPMTYKISVDGTFGAVRGGGNTVNLEMPGREYLTMKIAEVVYNEPLDVSVFKVS